MIFTGPKLFHVKSKKEITRNTEYLHEVVPHPVATAFPEYDSNLLGGKQTGRMLLLELKSMAGTRRSAKSLSFVVAVYKNVFKKTSVAIKKSIGTRPNNYLNLQSYFG